MKRKQGTLLVVLGDQLDRSHPVIAELDRARDRVLFVEAHGEASHVWSHKARIALFFAAMRTFATELRGRGFDVEYLRIGTHAHASLGDAWRHVVARDRPSRVAATEPGDWRVLADLQRACAEHETPLDVRADPHFVCGTEDFAKWAGKRAQLRMEFFYRWMRQRARVLMDGDAPAGGRWNFDAENRQSFGRAGPRDVPAPPRVAPDAITREAIDDVARHFAKHPGSVASFAWPVTPAQAREALQSFVDERLAQFGAHQDAMWDTMPFGWHSLLSTSLNLKLLDPREAIAAAETAWREGRAPLASVEGFVRQILGWREFIRGVYWRDMPQLAAANHFGHARPLPKWYWTGETHMRCMRAVVGQTLEHGYAHHIQRLMITGNFALLAQVEPAQVCDWYLAVYVDAVDWVERPNTAGMALFADGGRFTSKPYVASGQYTNRMSNYCKGCRYDPAERTGERACPVTVLYWRFVFTHERALARNPRTALMARNAARFDGDERKAILAKADAIEARLDQA
ncbi:MAG: cryptochrome/photolyase family protein [Burkholderiales bacterium]